MRDREEKDSNDIDIKYLGHLAAQFVLDELRRGALADGSAFRRPHHRIAGAQHLIPEYM